MGNRFIDYLRGPEGRPGEARLLRKLDFFILSFCCLMYFANYVGVFPSCPPRSERSLTDE